MDNKYGFGKTIQYPFDIALNKVTQELRRKVLEY